METVEKRTLQYKVSDSKKADCAFFKPEKYDSQKQELAITESRAPDKLCWRMIHDGKTCWYFYEDDVSCATAFEMFCGTLKECEAEIKRIGLTMGDGVEPVALNPKEADAPEISRLVDAGKG